MGNLRWLSWKAQLAFGELDEFKAKLKKVLADKQIETETNFDVKRTEDGLEVTFTIILLEFDNVKIVNKVKVPFGGSSNELRKALQKWLSATWDVARAAIAKRLSNEL